MDVIVSYLEYASDLCNGIKDKVECAVNLLVVDDCEDGDGGNSDDGNSDDWDSVDEDSDDGNCGVFEKFNDVPYVWEKKGKVFDFQCGVCMKEKNGLSIGSKTSTPFMDTRVGGDTTCLCGVQTDVCKLKSVDRSCS